MESELAEKCITCLGEIQLMHDLFEIFDDCLDLAGVLKLCLHCEISKPYLPSKLCHPCFLLLKEFYKFKMKFINNEITLKKRFETKLLLDVKDVEDEEFLKDHLDGDIIFEIIGEEEVNENLTNDVEDIDNEMTAEIEREPENNEDVEEYQIVSEINTEPEVSESVTEIKKEYEENVLFSEDNEVKYSEEPTNHKCFICKKFFIDSGSLNVHSFEHLKHKCDVCGKSFAKRCYLLNHVHIHKKERDVACLVCDKYFKTRRAMRSHMMIHTNPGRYVCETCGRSFNHHADLKTHKSLKHSQNRDYLCLWCGMDFNLKSSLDKHTLRKHANTKRTLFKCSECNMRYLDKHYLKRHFESKHSASFVGERCEICQKTLCSKSNLKRHMKATHGREF